MQVKLRINHQKIKQKKKLSERSESFFIRAQLLITTLFCPHYFVKYFLQL